MEAENRSLTPKERFDMEMNEINKTISASDAPEKEAGYSHEEAMDLEDEVECAMEAMDSDQEEIVDKHIGTKKVEVTKEQNTNLRLEQQRKDILSKFNGIGGLRKENLSPKQEAVISEVLQMAEDETLEDAVLKHLVEKKVEVAKEYEQLNDEIKELQFMIIDKMGKLAQSCTESQMISKTCNRDILLYVQKNPDSIKLKK
jgi:hypothetical protein